MLTIDEIVSELEGLLPGVALDACYDAVSLDEVREVLADLGYGDEVVDAVLGLST